jgi:FkbM family methyltransferase
MPHVIDVLKTIRATPIFNRPATTTTRALLKVLGRQSELVIRYLPRGGRVAVELPNGCVLRLWSLGDDWVTNQVFWRGWNGHEPETSSLFFPLAMRARTVFDIGAHIGYYTLLAALANRGVRIYAFEPMPAIFARLQRNVSLNEVGSRVTCVASAVGAADGTAELFYPETIGIPSAASLSREFLNARSSANIAAMQVPVLALDSFVRKHGIVGVDLVKLDTESSEAEALRGMSAILRRDRPLIVTEILKGGSTGPAVEGILRPLDYRYYALRDDGPAEVKHIGPDSASRNHLLVPAEKLMLAEVSAVVSP